MSFSQTHFNAQKQLVVVDTSDVVDLQHRLLWHLSGNRSQVAAIWSFYSPEWLPGILYFRSINFVHGLRQTHRTFLRDCLRRILGPSHIEKSFYEEAWQGHNTGVSHL